MVILTISVDAQTGPDIRLVLQITIDRLRANLINRSMELIPTH
jgi:hypothetical protein